MRLHRIALTDYRSVRERTVLFAEQGVTIVAGPNEIGKTSLVEALDLLVEEKASSTRREVMAVQPVGRDVGPTVEAELSFGRYRVVYRKQWIKGKSTELHVLKTDGLSPTPEQLSGNPAHERFGELLREAGIDLFLWRQLRISQDWQRARAQELRADGQSAIAGRAAVSGALEERSAQIVRTGPEEALFELALREYELYYTPKRGDPRGEYAASRVTLDEANREVEAAKQALADAEGAIAEQARVRVELAEAGIELDETRADLASLEEQAAELAGLREQQRRADAALALAQQIEAATADLGRFAARSADLNRDIASSAKELAVAQVDRNAADLRANELRVESQQLRSAARLAEDDVRWHRDRQAADRLAAQVDRAQDAAGRIRTADLVLAANPITEEVLERIEAAHKRWDTASAVLEANAATVTITPLGEANFTVERGDPGPANAGSDTAGSTIANNANADSASSADSAAVYPAIESITVEAPGVVRVVVTPGSGERERRKKERTSREAYRRLCADAGIADLSAAKDAQHRRRAAEDERRAAVQERDAAIADVAQDGEALPDLQDQLAALRERIAAHESGRPIEPPAAPTLEAALAAATELRDAQETAEVRLQVAAAEAAHEEQHVVELNTMIVSLQRAVDDAAEDTKHAKERMAQLPAARTASELADYRAARQAAARRIEELNPEQLERRLDTVRPLPARLEAEQSGRRERMAALNERIATLADHGPEESLDRALARQARAQRTYDEMHRDAAAAKLLYETLDRHRSRAWLRYAEPFRALVEKYATGVFGPGVGISVAEDLTISAKTVDGSTIAFNQLSAGAREQLALLGRIACAELITPSGAQDVGGVPLILDDALGHTDRPRLDQLAAILDRAGSRVQIILLTHAPERFRIGGAHRVDL
ncbi:MAG TPA: AAA family ATPase [Actinocrinis sp.]|uniref:AAA family ATPase n=1 Tax=Actinocrinis sp. TaxID=1920516 RepID=UPI002DDD7B27|nr:AAA family ATPase [Actinocrinis sp.]HEV2345712.1 AAA family ATPase [Actinocrinis sp.]